MVYDTGAFSPRAKSLARKLRTMGLTLYRTKRGWDVELPASRVTSATHLSELASWVRARQDYQHRVGDHD